MRFLKQNTAATIPLGPFTDVDGAPLTALTISQADVRLTKNGGTFAQANESSAASHMENAYYAKALNATDTNTLGHLRVAVAESGALPVWEDCMVMPANVWDSMFGADFLQVHLVELTNTLGLNPVRTGTAQAGGASTITLDAGASAIDNFYRYDLIQIVAGTGVGQARIGTGYVGATKVLTVGEPWVVNPDATSVFVVNPSGVVSSSVGAIADAVWDEALAGHVGSGSTGNALNAAGASGDPWTTTLPGAYGAGTAGKIIGDNLNAPISGIPTANANADALLKRDWTGMTGEAARSVLNALRFLRNYWVIDPITGRLSVKKENDSTEAWGGPVSTSVGGDPVNSINPD